MIYIYGAGISRFLIETVSTPEELRLGLSGRTMLPPRQGMLFVFPKTAIQNIWMKNMYFPIDIIWISEDRIITKIYENIQPCLLHNECTRYSSETPVLYGLELNAFDASRIGLHIGLQLNSSFLAI
jgi:uncharacterized membrane protein (UPF0127 family)